MTSELHHLVTAYALDALDGDERATFEEHLASCADCRADLAGFGSVATRLADASATAPPPDLKARIMSEIAWTEQLPADAADDRATVDRAGVTRLADRRRRFRPASILALAAALALLTVGAVVVIGLRDRGPGVGDVRAAPDAIELTLDRAVDDGATGSIAVIWSARRNQLALVGSGLDVPGPGLTYELWAIAGDTAMPAALFEPDGGSVSEVVDVAADDDVIGWGVTIEPAGGSPAPTGEVLFFGEL